MNSSEPMNMRDGTVVSEKMEPTVPPLVCRDVKASKRRFNCNNGNLFSTVGNEIRIPLSGNFVLQNNNVNFCCKLNITAGDGVSVAADFSWASLFSQIRVEAGSGSSIILEQIDDPGLWASFLYQYTWEQSNISIQNAKQLSMLSQPSSTGGLTKSGTASALTTAAPTAYLNIVLDLSQFMGIFYANSGIPLYNTDGLTVVLVMNTLGSIANANSTGATKIEVENPYITCNCLEGGEKYEAALKEMKTKNGEVSIMFNTCRRYIQSASGSGMKSLLIGEKAKSVIGFVAMARDTAAITLPAAYSNSTSLFPTLTNYVYQIAGENFPVQPITGSSQEGIDEAYDLYSQVSRRYDSGGLLSRTQSATQTPADATAQTALFASATGPSHVLTVNLAKCGPNESYWGKGKNLSGSSLNTYLNVDYTPLNAQTVTIFSIFQQKVHIDAMGNMSNEI
jgi:hypothetical protein